MSGQIFLVFPDNLMPSRVGHNLWNDQRYLGKVTAPANTAGQGPKWDDLCGLAPWIFRDHLIPEAC